MRTILILLVLLGSVPVVAQVVDSVKIVEPANFPIDNNLPGNRAAYDREDGVNKKWKLSQVYSDLALRIEATPVNFTPSPTGNVQNTNQVIEDPNGHIWLIDRYGSAIILLREEGTDTFGPLNNGTTVTLSRPQSAAYNLRVRRNGIEQHEGRDYTQSGTQLQFIREFSYGEYVEVTY